MDLPWRPRPASLQDKATWNVVCPQWRDDRPAVQSSRWGFIQRCKKGETSSLFYDFKVELVRIVGHFFRAIICSKLRLATCQMLEEEAGALKENSWRRSRRCERSITPLIALLWELYRNSNTDSHLGERQCRDWINGRRFPAANKRTSASYC